MKIILYYMLFIVIYTTLAVTTAMFFLTWGAKRSLLEKIYIVFIGRPFNWSNSLWYVPLNGIIWATFFLIIRISFNKVSALLKT